MLKNMITSLFEFGMICCIEIEVSFIIESQCDFLYSISEIAWR
jgi:hypothetical protein